jgi:hypothetical protein
MCLVDFLQHLKRYGRDRLPELMIKTSNSGEAKYGFVFVPHDRDGVDLMLEGERLGSVKWVDGDMVYEPPIEFSERLSFDGHLDQWVSRACQKAGAEFADGGEPGVKSRAASRIISSADPGASSPGEGLGDAEAG